MISYFRENIQGTFAKIFVVLISVPFVLVGVESFFTGSSDASVAKVNGESIGESAAQREIQLILNEQRQRMGDSFDPSSIDESILRPIAVDRLVKRKLAEIAAEKQGLVAADTVVDQLIVEQEAFQEDGQFSPERYKNLLRGANYTPTTYKELVRRDIVARHLQGAIAGSEFLTASERDQFLAFDYQTRDIAYVVLDADAERSMVALDDAQIQAYYDANAEQYLTEETVNLTYVELKLEDFLEPVSEADIEQAYEQQVAELSTPERRQAAHILLTFDNDEAKAEALEKSNAIKDRLAANEDFAALAQEFSEDEGSASTGGDLGYTSGELFPAEFEAALASLELGQVSEAVETDAGLHLIKLLDIEAGVVPTLNDMRAGIEEELKRLQATPKFERALEDFKDLAFDSDAIDDVAEELDLKAQTSGAFDRAGANSGLFSRRGLVDMAFSSQVRLDERLSDVTEVSAEHFIVAQLADRTEPQQRALDDVRSLIVDVLTDQAVATVLEEKSQAALSRLETGEAFDVVAADLGLTLETVEAATRRALPQKDRLVVMSAFDVASQSLPAVEVLDAGSGSVAVVQVSKVELGDAESVDVQTSKSFASLLENNYANETYTSYDAALFDAAKIERN